MVIQPLGIKLGISHKQTAVLEGLHETATNCAESKKEFTMSNLAKRPKSRISSSAVQLPTPTPRNPRDPREVVDEEIDNFRVKSGAISSRCCIDEGRHKNLGPLP